jgi:hypothetical protein
MRWAVPSSNVVLKKLPWLSFSVQICAAWRRNAAGALVAALIGILQRLVP